MPPNQAQSAAHTAPLSSINLFKCVVKYKGITTSVVQLFSRTKQFKGCISTVHYLLNVFLFMFDTLSLIVSGGFMFLGRESGKNNFLQLF